jgi:hypothetical protein
MSTEEDKFKHSKRLLKDENAIKKQVKIAKQHRVSEYNPGEPKQPHRFNKHHAMDCGNPECFMCGNPRKTHKDKLTAQEKRLFQDVEKSTDRHSNGTLPPTEINDERED